MPATATHLYDLAATLLAVAEDAVAQARTGVAPPTQVYLAHQDPLADDCCPQLTDPPDEDDDGYGGGILTVHLGSPDGDPIDFTPPDSQCQMRTLANFTVTLLRCVPTLGDDGHMPAPDELTVSARRLLVDLWCLVTGLRDARREALWPTGIECGSFKFTTTNALPPEGGCGGWQVTVQVATNDQGPAQGS